MRLLLAVEPDQKQAARLGALVRGPLEAELLVAETARRAVALLKDRVPDLILTSQLLSPKDEAFLDAHLRKLDAAGLRVQTLVIPVLASPSRRSRESQQGLLKRLRRTAKDASAHGCDPAVFAAQIAEYLERAAADRIAAERARLAPPAAPAAPAQAAEPGIIVNHETARSAPPSESGWERKLDTLVDPGIEPAEARVDPEEPQFNPEEPRLDPVESPFAPDDLPVAALQPPDVAPDIPLRIDAPVSGPAEPSIWLTPEPTPALAPAMDEPPQVHLIRPAVEDDALTELAAVPETATPLEPATSLNLESIDLTAFLEELEVQASGPATVAGLTEPAFEPAVIEVAAGPPDAELAVGPADAEIQAEPADAPPLEIELDSPVAAVFPLAAPVEAPISVPPPPESAAAPAPELLEMLNAIRRDLEALRTEGAAPPPAPPRVGERVSAEAVLPAPGQTVAQPSIAPPIASTSTSPSLAPAPPVRPAPPAAAPAAATGTAAQAVAATPAGAGPAETPPAKKRAAKKKKKKKAAPLQDEWGLFDPEQCGFAALLAKLDEITEGDEDPPKRSK